MIALAPYAIAVALTVGAVAYAYHEGAASGRADCEADHRAALATAQGRVRDAEAQVSAMGATRAQVVSDARRAASAARSAGSGCAMTEQQRATVEAIR